MNWKVLTFILIIFFHANKISAVAEQNLYSIEDVRYSKDISFPFVVSKLPEKVEVANRINRRLQDVLFEKGTNINNNIQSIKEHLYIRNDSIDQSGISSLSYTFKFYPNFLKITIDIDWAGGPYPVGAKTDNFQFDLEKGELILMPDLIDGTKYFDFLEKFWLDDCRYSIKAMHQCAYGNETSNYESDSAYTLEGKCEFQCHIMNHQFILTKDSIFISNNSNCFPHVWQNCNYGASKYLKINEIKDYLSDYGKWVLGLTDSYCNIKPFFHFVGKVDDKYKISLTLCQGDKDVINGEYFYWKQNKKIAITGQIKSADKKVFLDEFVDNSKTGRFELEWTDFLYSTNGVWLNSKNGKKLPVKLMNIYDFRDRDYYR